jgi:succinate-acetate transporter protein
MYRRLRLLKNRDFAVHSLYEYVCFWKQYFLYTFYLSVPSVFPSKPYKPNIVLNIVIIFLFLYFFVLYNLTIMCVVFNSVLLIFLIKNFPFI